MIGLLELFFQASEKGSAKVLAFVQDHGMEEFVQLRDVVLEDARDDLRLRCGTAVPALWDGERLHQGAEAVIARLAAFLNVGRAD